MLKMCAACSLLVDNAKVLWFDYKVQVQWMETGRLGADFYAWKAFCRS